MKQTSGTAAMGRARPCGRLNKLRPMPPFAPIRTSTSTSAVGAAPGALPSRPRHPNPLLPSTLPAGPCHTCAATHNWPIASPAPSRVRHCRPRGRRHCRPRGRHRRLAASASMAEQLPAALRNVYWLLRHGRSTANEQDLIVSWPEHGQEARWGLTDQGRRQATAAGEELCRRLGAHDPAALLVLASPFSRTVETAQAAAAALGVQPGDARLQVGRLGREEARRPGSWKAAQGCPAPAAAHAPSQPLMGSMPLPLLVPARTRPFRPPSHPRPQLEPALRERHFGSHELTSCAHYGLVWAADAQSTAARCGNGNGRWSEGRACQPWPTACNPVAAAAGCRPACLASAARALPRHLALTHPCCRCMAPAGPRARAGSLWRTWRLAPRRWCRAWKRSTAGGTLCWCPTAMRCPSWPPRCCGCRWGSTACTACPTAACCASPQPRAARHDCSRRADRVLI